MDILRKLKLGLISIDALMSVKVTINHDECTACGLCYNDECPDVFEEGEDGLSLLKAPFRKAGPTVGEIPDDKKGCAEAAADACPVSAIVLS